MPKITFVSNVSDLGFFRGLAATRGRLATSAAVATLLAFGGGLGAAHYIMERSASVGGNMALITLVLLLVLGAAYLQALLAGDLFFPGPWRQQVILGDRALLEHAATSEDEDVQTSVHDHSAEFMILLVLGFVLTSAGINLAAGGFMGRYNTEGFFRTQLRSPVVEDRLTALKDMANPTQTSLWTNPQLHLLVTETIGDAEPRVREQAIWNAGAMQIEGARAPLMSALADTAAPDTLRAEAAIALGKLGESQAAREALIALALKPKTPSPLRVGALRGLTLMKAHGATQAIAPLMHDADPAVSLHALWMLRELRARHARPAIKAAIEAISDDPKQLNKRCDLYDTLKLISEEDDILWARRQFLSAPADARCERILWTERDDHNRVIRYGDTFRVKTLKIVANTGHAHKHRDFFSRIVADSTHAFHTREVAATILKELDKASKLR